MKAVTELNKRLAAGEIIRMPVTRWEKVASGFPLIEAVETSLAGQILLVHRQVPGGGSRPAWAIVEEPAPLERVLRPCASEKEARALIGERLAIYERMWDG